MFWYKICYGGAGGGAPVWYCLWLNCFHLCVSLKGGRGMHLIGRSWLYLGLTGRLYFVYFVILVCVVRHNIENLGEELCVLFRVIA